MKILFLTSAAMLSLAGVAFAQDPAAPIAQLPAPAASAPAPVSDADIQKVAAIAADVKALNATHQPTISAAADTTAKSAAQKELDTAIRGSLTRNGLTVDRYNEIARAAHGDRALAARISAANAVPAGSASP